MPNYHDILYSNSRSPLFERISSIRVDRKQLRILIPMWIMSWLHDTSCNKSYRTTSRFCWGLQTKIKHVILRNWQAQSYNEISCNRTLLCIFTCEIFNHSLSLINFITCFISPAACNQLPDCNVWRLPILVWFWRFWWNACFGELVVMIYDLQMAETATATALYFQDRTT